MKLLKLLLLLLTIGVTGGCVAKNTNNVEVLNITQNTGDRKHHIFISTTTEKIDSSYQNDPILKESIEDFYGADKYIVSQKALSHLIQFVNTNCNAVPENERKKLALFVVRSYSNQGAQICYYYDRTESGKYFTDMIAWLKQSPFESEYSPIIEQLELFKRR